MNLQLIANEENQDRAQCGKNEAGGMMGRRKCANMRSIFDFSAENAEIADCLAEQDEFELPVPVLELLTLSARRTRTAMAPAPAAIHSETRYLRMGKSLSAMEYANLSTNHGRTAALFHTKSDDTSENISRRVRNTA
jgi:hypothetical protein